MNLHGCDSVNGEMETGVTREQGRPAGSKAIKRMKHGSREIESLVGSVDGLGEKMMVSVDKLATAVETISSGKRLGEKLGRDIFAGKI